ncbi:MAG: hypothetical protein Q9M91_00130 [Candidatus Dojkabacteria bacterium]|nr:hypothetical protein [Candidatus Dojkabacteria bacterium]
MMPINKEKLAPILFILVAGLVIGSGVFLLMKDDSEKKSNDTVDEETEQPVVETNNLENA